MAGATPALEAQRPGWSELSRRSPRRARLTLTMREFTGPESVSLPPDAFLLHMAAITWSAQHGTGGFIGRDTLGRFPFYAVLSRAVRLRRAELLVGAGLWEPEHAWDGWLIKDFDRLTSGGRWPDDVDEPDETSWSRSVRATAEYRAARKEALGRDGHRCRAIVDGAMCGATDDGIVWLEVHHIIPISEGGEPSSAENLVTLCNVCHRADGHGQVIFIQGSDA